MLETISMSIHGIALSTFLTAVGLSATISLLNSLSRFCAIDISTLASSICPDSKVMGVCASISKSFFLNSHNFTFS